MKRKIIKIHFSAYFMATFAVILLGTNAVALKVATQTMDPLVYASLRYVAIGAILLLFVKNFRFLRKKRIWLKIMPGAIFILLCMAFFSLGVSQSGALKASILSLTTPVFVYIFSILLLHEPVIKRIIFGGLVALIGSLLLVGLPVVFGQKFELGDALLLGSYVMLAAGVIHAKYMFKWLTPNELLSVRFTLAGIGLLSYVLLVLKPGVVLVGDPIAWLLLLYSIVFTGIIAHTLYYRALSRMKAEQAAPLFYVDPMTGTVLAAILLGERLEYAAIIGAIIILVGVVVSYPHHNHLFYHYSHPKKRTSGFLHSFVKK